MKKILITGATGFVGMPLCRRMLREGRQVRGAVRTLSGREQLPPDVDAVLVGPIGPDTTWYLALEGIDTIVHLAARTHVMRELDQDPLQAYRSINVEGTERLARSAAAAGVKRFIYLSSVKVNGEGKAGPYTELDAPAPEDAYGISKGEAEQVLRRIGKETGMEVVILRPPLVYGPGVKANFLRMIDVLNRGIPLPLASINNRRSFIYLDNLVDAIIRCIEHPAAANQTFLVSDGQDISTPDLIRMIAGAMGKKARLFPCPAPLLKMIGNIAGKSDEIERLIGSLQIDNSKIRRELSWTPPFTMEQGLKETAEWFMSNEKNI